MRIPAVWEGFEPGADDAGESRSPGVSPGGSAEERPAGGPADQFQGGTLRRRGADRAASESRGRHRAGPPSARRRCGRNSGEAQGARFHFRAARQMADADRRQLPLHPAERHDPHQRGGARERRRVPQRSTTGCRDSAPGSAPSRPTSFLSRSTPRPPRAWANPPPRRARSSAAPSTSSGSTAWYGGSPASADCSPTRCTRSSRWWTSVWQETARSAAKRSNVETLVSVG